MGKPRGRPFKSGNPGRPPGSRNRVTQMLQQLAEGQAEQIFQKILEGALAGDGPCQKMLMDRIWPPRKAQPINVRMPPINSSQARSGARSPVRAWTSDSWMIENDLAGRVARSISLVA